MDDPVLASGGYDRTVRLWDVRSSRCTGTMYDHDARVSSVQLSNNRLVSGSSDKVGAFFSFSSGLAFAYSPPRAQTVKLWNAKTRKVLLDLEGSTAAIKKLQFDEKKIVGAGKDGRVYVWNFSETMPY